MIKLIISKSVSETDILGGMAGTYYQAGYPVRFHLAAERDPTYKLFLQNYNRAQNVWSDYSSNIIQSIDWHTILNSDAAVFNSDTSKDCLIGVAKAQGFHLSPQGNTILGLYATPCDE